MLSAVEATRRWAGDRITGNAVMPGGVWTRLQRHWDPASLVAAKASVAEAGWTAKTPEQGAATTVLVATSPLLAGIGGRYLEDCHEVVPEIVDDCTACATTPSTRARRRSCGMSQSSCSTRGNGDRHHPGDVPLTVDDATGVLRAVRSPPGRAAGDPDVMIAQ